MAKNLGTFSTADNSEVIKVVNQKTHAFNVITTSVVDSVIVRIEHSNDNQNWFNVTTKDCIITADTSTNLVVTEVFPVNFLRFTYVSGTGDAQVYYTNY